MKTKLSCLLVCGFTSICLMSLCFIGTADAQTASPGDPVTNPVPGLAPGTILVDADGNFFCLWDEDGDGAADWAVAALPVNYDPYAQQNGTSGTGARNGGDEGMIPDYEVSIDEMAVGVSLCFFHPGISVPCTIGYPIVKWWGTANAIAMENAINDLEPGVHILDGLPPEAIRAADPLYIPDVEPDWDQLPAGW
ncbi:MAG: hypothetical protein AAF456_24495 [Planctomycetota bacterium]